MLRVSRDGGQCFGCDTEEDAVDHLLVLVGDGSDLLRHGKDDVKIGRIEEFGLPILDPLRPGQRLAFGAVPVAARVEAMALMAALVAAFEVAAESRRAAHLDGGHDASLRQGHRRVMLVSIGLPVATEHVRHFQLGAVHGPRTQQD